MRRYTQVGLTLLEVLIALSIFAMIGVTSYRVLNTVITSQQINEKHSNLLMASQKTLLVLSRDIEFWADRSIRTESGVKPSLILDDLYPLEFTRLGWRNPLQLSRSQLQRVAYDVGFHPERDNRESPYFESETQFLRRHYWPILDRKDHGQKPVTQLLLADVETLEVIVISDDDGVLERHEAWPLKVAANSTQPLLVGLELHIKQSKIGDISRIYKVN